jgi:hypothetical protein
MKFLKEVLTGIRRMDDQPAPQEELNLDAPLDDTDGGPPADDPIDDELSLDPDEQEPLDPETDQELGDVVDQATEDPDRQGMIRAVKNAHLVYKRESDEGTYEELWVYNVSSLRGELDVKKAILAGTDIPVNKTHSPDGSQSYEIWAAGNAEMIMIKGLPN